MQIIDTRGHQCPAPLIMTKRAIKSSSQGDQFTVITDNDTARHNLLSFLAEMGFKTTCTEKENEFQILFSTDGKAVEIPEVEEFCEIGKKGSYVVAIKSDVMGQGSDELGAMLIRSCINSLIEVEPLPRAIVMYNSGIMLAMKQKDTGGSLEKLAMQGVKIVVCGACVDYFGIKESLIESATISNMYKINTILAAASHVIYP